MPIEEIATVSQSVSGEDFRTRLPFFTDGLLAISSEARMSDFLRNKVSSDYQRRMSFATQTPRSRRKVQDYVDQISSDWNGGDRSAEATRRGSEARRRASLDSLPADSFVEIRFVDSGSGEERRMRYGLSMPLKTLFKKYAEERGCGLRRLRFSYGGRTLFLSSVGLRTPQDLRMGDNDAIHVTDCSSPPSPGAGGESSGSSGDESGGSAGSAPGKSKP